MSPESPEKFYGQPVWNGMVTIDELAQIISGRSSLTAGDVSNVLHNVLDEMPRLMLMGMAVDLENLGIFRVSFSSRGSITKEDFKSNMLYDPKVLFRASAKMKKRIADGITYSRVVEKKSDKDDKQVKD